MSTAAYSIIGKKLSIIGQSLVASYVPLSDITHNINFLLSAQFSELTASLME